jgi:hypothetical protein
MSLLSFERGGLENVDFLFSDPVGVRFLANGGRNQ